MYGVFYVMRMFFRVTILNFFSGFYGVFWEREGERNETGKSENETVAAVSFFVLLFWTFFWDFVGFSETRAGTEREREVRSQVRERNRNRRDTANGASRSCLLGERARSPHVQK